MVLCRARRWIVGSCSTNVSRGGDHRRSFEITPHTLKMNISSKPGQVAGVVKAKSIAAIQRVSIPAYPFRDSRWKPSIVSEGQRIHMHVYYDSRYNIAEHIYLSGAQLNAGRGGSDICITEEQRLCVYGAALHHSKKNCLGSRMPDSRKIEHSLAMLHVESLRSTCLLYRHVCM